MKMLRCGLILFPIVLIGCASGLPGLRPLTYATSGEAQVYATGDNCVHEAAGKEASGLLAAALSGVASSLLKNFGVALSEGAKGGALPSSTSMQNLQLETGKIPKCIVIIRGAFQQTADNPAPINDLAKYLDIESDAQDKRKRLGDLKLPPIYRIDHFIELRLGASNNSKALTFAPVFVKLAQSIDGDTKGERDLSIAVKFSRAGAESVGSAVVLADRKIGRATVWQVGENGRYAIEAPWFGTFHALPALSGGTPATGAEAKSALLTKAAPEGVVGGGGAGAGGSALPTSQVEQPGSTTPSMQSDSPDAFPVTITATVVETRPTKEGLAFVASIFNGLQPKIEETIKPMIDSDARRTANAAEATTTLGAQADFATAEGTARAALITYCSASSSDTTTTGKEDRISKSTAARVAQLKANVAAIKAEVPQPHVSLVTISAELPASANPQCSAK